MRPDRGNEVACCPLEPGSGRSEEHTSELQSRQYLVCRFLLEKKITRDGFPTVPMVSTGLCCRCLAPRTLTRPCLGFRPSPPLPLTCCTPRPLPLTFTRPPARR